MAFLRAPDHPTFPNDPSELVVELMGGGAPAILTRVMLAAPAANQLIPPAPAPESGMYVWQRSIVDSLGEIIPGARVSVRRAEDGILAEIFDDREGTLQKSNPFDADNDGFARFYANPGLYDVSAEDGGLIREWEDELLGVRAVDLPDLTAIVSGIAGPLIDDAIAAAIDAFEASNPGVDVLYIPASGTGAIMPPGYSVAHPSAGLYNVTVPAGAGAISATGTIFGPPGAGNSGITIDSTTTNGFSYRTWNAAGNSADNHAAFLFVKRLPV